MPDVSLLLKFLKDKMRTTPISATSFVKPEIKVEQPHQPKKYMAPVNAAQPNSSARSSCSLCNWNQHSFFFCPTFRTMTVEGRSTHVRTSNLCFNCLGFGHPTRECRSNSRCKKCSNLTILFAQGTGQQWI